MRGGGGVYMVYIRLWEEGGGEGGHACAASGGGKEGP